MRSTLVMACLLVLSTSAPDPAAAQTTAILSQADRASGDDRHKLDLVSGQAWIAIACRTDRPDALSSVVLIAPGKDWPSGQVRIDLARGDGAARTLSFTGSLDLLIASENTARQLASFGLASGDLVLRTPEGASAAFDLRPPQVASALARFKKLCQF